MALLNTIIKIFGSSLPALTSKVLGLGQDVIKYLQAALDRKERKDMEKSRKSDDKAIDDVCDKGSVSDLLDLGNRLAKSLFFALALVCGCQTTIEVTTAK